MFHLGLNAFDTVANTIMSQTGGGGDLVKQWARMHSGMETRTPPVKIFGTWQRAGSCSFVSSFLGDQLYGSGAGVSAFLGAYLLAGVVLYGLGPCLRLYPSGSLGTYTKGYLKGVATWGMWPVLYALFSSLLVLIHMNTVANVENANNFLGWLSGLGSTFLVGIVSLLLAIAVALIPLFAGSVINGDIGGAIGRVAEARWVLPKDSAKGRRDK